MQSNEKGRSMIEMLGVLSIVGILTVGGISGYLKAVNKYNFQRLMGEANTIFTNIRTLYSQQRNYHGLNNMVALQAGLIPEEMYDRENITGYILHSANGNVHIYSSKTDGDDHGAFIVTFDGLSYNNCVMMLLADWGSNADSGLIAIAVGTGTGVGILDDVTPGTVNPVVENTNGVSLCSYLVPGHETCHPPISPTTASGWCSATELNAIVWKYY